MGIDRNLYLGPYAKTTTEVVSKEEDRCGHLPLDTQEKFCSECGTRISDRIYRHKGDAVSFYPEEAWKNPDALSSTSWVGPPEIYKKGEKEYRDYLWLPNASRPGKPKRKGVSNVDKHDEVVIDIQNVDIEAEIEWFKTAYPELQKLEEAFGNLTVGWGFIQWFS